MPKLLGLEICLTCKLRKLSLLPYKIGYLLVNVEAISDLLPDSFSGIDDNDDCDDLFKKYLSWLGIHMAKFLNNQKKL